ncbi:MAG: SDR family oxidoreductase [Acidobacteria bacterium]|nr:SDR family oxidoreductase [Acidobacteriota bacterium]
MTLLVIGDSGIARAITVAMRAGDRSVATVTDTAVFEKRDTAAAALAAAIDGAAITTVVFAHLDPSGFRTAAITELTEPAWDTACERSLRHAFVALQQVHALVADGTPIVLVLPNVGAVGVAGLVPLCSAVEGIRVMAKAMARRWGARGITVNTIEVELAAFILGDLGAEGAGTAVPEVPVLGSPALAPGSAVADVVGLIDLLASPEGRAVTGAFLMADRGTVMLP